jgi:hypothetical protein
VLLINAARSAALYVGVAAGGNTSTPAQMRADAVHHGGSFVTFTGGGNRTLGGKGHGCAGCMDRSPAAAGAHDSATNSSRHGLRRTSAPVAMVLNFMRQPGHDGILP